MRKTAREVAFMLIYEGLFNKARDVEFSFDAFIAENEVFENNALTAEDESYIKQLVCLYEANKEHIETIINNFLKNSRKFNLF